MADEQKFGPSQEDLNRQKEYNDLVMDARSRVQELNADIGKQININTRIGNQLRSQDRLLSKLQIGNKDIAKISADQILSIQDQAEASVAEVTSATELFAQKVKIRDLQDETAILNRATVEELKQAGKLTEKEADLLFKRAQGIENLNEAEELGNQLLQKRIDFEEKLVELQGLTGASIKSARGAMKGLGMEAFSSYLGFDAAKKAMDETAIAIAKGEKAGGALTVKMAGVKEGFLGALRAATSLEAVLAGMTAGSANVNNLQKQLGISYQNAYRLNLELAKTSFLTEDTFMNSERARKSFAQLTEQMGMSAQVLDSGALQSMSELTEIIGLSEEGAGRLVQLFGSQGQSTREMLETGIEQLNTFNKQNKTMIVGSKVMKDVQNISLAVATNLGKNPKRLIEAAASAQKLGLNLEAVNKIAESMLNFESSIDAELQAQLLSGKALNLSRARELAMMGEQDKLGDEIGRQEAVREAFASKNVIVQRSIANALGLSVEELAKINQQQELNRLGAEKFADIYGEQTYQSLTARNAAEKFGDTLNKIKTILIDMASTFTPIVDGLAYVMSFPGVPQFAAAAIGALAFGKRIMAIGGALGRLTGITKGATAAQAALNTAQQASTNLAKSPTSAFSTINTTALLKGAAAMAVAAGGIFIFGKAIQELEKVEDYEAVAKGLGAFVVTMGLSTAIMSAFAPVAYPAAAAMIAFGGAVALMGAGVNLASKGFAIVTDSLSTLSSINLVGVGAGLASVGTGMMAMMSGSLLGGLGAMAVLGTIATLASPLTKSASAVQLLANSFGKLGDNIDSLDTDKLNEIKEIVVSDTIAAPITAAAANIGELIGTINGGGESSNNKELISRMDTLIAAVQAGGTVYIDSKAAGEASVLNNFKS